MRQLLAQQPHPLAQLHDNDVEIADLTIYDSIA